MFLLLFHTSVCPFAVHILLPIYFNMVLPYKSRVYSGLMELRFKEAPNQDT
jgi:hypothetical protein